MSKKRIAFIISNLGQGGAEKQLTSLITNLNTNVFYISLLLYAAQVTPFDEKSIKSTNIITTKNKLKRKFFIFKIIEALICIRRFLKKDEYDIVVSSLFMNNLFVRLVAPSSYKDKIVTSIRTSLNSYSAFYILCEKILIKHSYVVCNSKRSFESLKKLLPARHHHRLSMIYNGFETNIVSEESNSNTIIFGSLGRFSTEKNILQPVRVFQNIEQTIPGSKLIIQGHYGSQYEEIIKTISSKNVLINEKNPDADKFYDTIRILILPSLFEGCPNVLFEALLRKKICIISSGANTDDFIKNGINGFVYNGTDDGLKQAMQSVIRILNTPEEIKIIEEGYHYTINNFSLASMISNYEKLFIRIYEENKGSHFAEDHSTLQGACI